MISAGNFTWRRLETLLSRYFSASHKGVAVKQSRRPPEVRGECWVRRKSLEQVHLCLGLQGLSAGHKDRYAAHALERVLAGCELAVISRGARSVGLLLDLFVLVDVLGWRYDHGVCGHAPGEVERVVEVVCRELKKLRTNGIDRKDLARVKNQMKGSLMLSLKVP